LILYKNNKMSKLKSSDDVNGSKVFVYFSEVLENGEFQIKRTEMTFKNKEEEETFFKETDDPFIKIDKNEPFRVMKKKIKEISKKMAEEIAGKKAEKPKRKRGRPKKVVV